MPHHTAPRLARRSVCFTAAAWMVLAMPLPAGAAIDTVADYRQAFAQAIHAAAPEWVHDRRPQPLLRAVIVLNIRLGADRRWHAHVLRTNDQQPEMLARAIETVHRARPAEAPAALHDELRRHGFVETWLFDRDGSFQVKTLARPQQGL